MANMLEVEIDFVWT